MQAIQGEQPELPLKHVSHAEEAVRLQLDKEDHVLAQFEFGGTKSPSGNASKSAARLLQIYGGLFRHLAKQVALNVDGDEAVEISIFVRSAFYEVDTTHYDCVSRRNQLIAGQENKAAGKS